jgi:alpha-tubulin suppressor-like RCC1 family protein
VYCWGSGRQGKLGIGSQSNVALAGEGIVEKIWNGNVRAVSCGYEHTMILDGEGDLFVWGGNTYGQLGLADFSARFYPVMQRESSEIEKAIKISCGAYHSAAVTRKRELFTWGSNEFGQLVRLLFHSSDLSFALGNWSLYVSMHSSSCDISQRKGCC